MISFAIGRIDFINTAPVYYGIDTGRVVCPGRPVEGPPTRLNRLLKENEIQISAVSSVAYAQAYPNWLLLPSLSISARGPVKSVLLCLKAPPCKGAAVKVGLSDKSATAQALTRILLEDRYKMNPSYLEVDLSLGIPKNLDGLLVIGDDALKRNFKETYPHGVDLGAFWIDWTGLPFVFGLWAVDRAFAVRHPAVVTTVVEALVTSKNLGKDNIPGAARLTAERTGVSEAVCKTYLAHIEYDFEADHRAGLERFFRLLVKRGEVKSGVEPSFWMPSPREACFGE
jgi:chorismate dehydratase